MKLDRLQMSILLNLDMIIMTYVKYYVVPCYWRRLKNHSPFVNMRMRRENGIYLRNLSRGS